MSGVKALEVKQYVCHARQRVHKQNNSNTKISKQYAAKVAEATKGHALEIITSHLPQIPTLLVHFQAV